MDDEYFMKQAIHEAKKANEAGEIPIGAVIVMNDKIIARGHNQVEKLNDSTAHAEMIALTSAFNFLGSKYLPDATLYITVEPCLMCAGALYWCKIGRVVYGADDEKNGAISPHPDAAKARHHWPFHPKTELTRGILKTECAELIQNFFRQKRG